MDEYCNAVKHGSQASWLSLMDEYCNAVKHGSQASWLSLMGGIGDCQYTAQVLIELLI
jgi:hypothetical protein